MHCHFNATNYPPLLLWNGSTLRPVLLYMEGTNAARGSGSCNRLCSKSVLIILFVTAAMVRYTSFLHIWDYFFDIICMHVSSHHSDSLQIVHSLVSMIASWVHMNESVDNPCYLWNALYTCENIWTSWWISCLRVRAGHVIMHLCFSLPCYERLIFDNHKEALFSW